MNRQARKTQRIYLLLQLLHTLAASFIWGINTLFLLDAGLSNAQAFTANAFFTAGLVIFEIPTGVVADTRGRRLSYLLGTVTLMVSTLLYLWMWQIKAPFWAWAVTSVFLGLGFTFFSGAVQAWLVDALRFHGYEGAMDPVFAKGQIVEGVAMLTGAVAGGFIAQATNLGVPYMLRAGILVITFVVAFLLMRDAGFAPARDGSPIQEVKKVLRGAIDHGMRNPPVRWVMLAEPFNDGVSIYAFYAMQPYLLQIYGDPNAYGIAGLAAAIFAGAQITGGLLVPYVRRVFRRRTSVMLATAVLSTLVLLLIAGIPIFWVAILLLASWSLMFAAVIPVRQAYLNDLIPSAQRATVLSFDSLLGSAGGVVSQPLLGRAADVWGYRASYACSAAVQILAIPFLLLARRERASSDRTAA
ncbi:MAG TPA: MFS transporter [Thermoanaerobaculia bacterium]|nr:MFS transporter [Thermoanaerobaculia bacterium]